MNRRDFLRAAAGYTLIAAPNPPRPKRYRPKGKKGMLPVIDTHQHLWNLRELNLAWLQGAGKLNRDYLMSDYLQASEGLNIVKTVYMEVDVIEENLVREAEIVFDLCQRDDNPLCGAVIGGRPASPDFKAYLDRFKNQPYFKGVRRVLHGGSQKGACLEPDFVKGVRLLGERGLRYDICIRSEELLDGAKLAELCPETAFVLDHCGNANVQSPDRSQWKRDIEQVAKRKNVVCKISGIVASAKPDHWTPEDLAPIILHCAEVFGKDRIIYASDWPVCTLAATFKQWIEALQTVVGDWSEADRKKLFHDNAHKFYELR